MASPRQLGIGERAIDFVRPGASGAPERFYAHAGGRPTVLVFPGVGPDSGTAALADRLAGYANADLHWVTAEPPSADSERRTWSDPEHTLAAAYGGDPSRPTIVVLDPNLRIVGVVAGDGIADEVVRLLEVASHRDVPIDVVGQAPVLLIPRVLDATHRDGLIRVWQEDGAEATGVARAGGDVLDADVKRRRDHVVRNPELLRDLTAAVGRRIMPEIRKAFAFHATRFEGFKIACYDATSGGFFRSHRDNLTPSTARRVFALTLNLNDDYSGGQLRFPEYGNQRYRPDAGTALVFSCAHLHEVLDVTDGRRFVLLSFLYGEPDNA
ncbi:MAG: hypothetical protein QOF18_2653 [Frankiaceae bacterium]|nr:hypothetical protein [Frankiaceae bacterium]